MQLPIHHQLFLTICYYIFYTMMYKHDDLYALNRLNFNFTGYITHQSHHQYITIMKKHIFQPLCLIETHYLFNQVTPLPPSMSDRKKVLALQLPNSISQSITKRTRSSAFYVFFTLYFLIISPFIYSIISRSLATLSSLQCVKLANQLCYHLQPYHL